MKTTATALMKYGKILLTLLVFSIVISGCASYDKIPYFQDLSRANISSEDINNFSLHTIQPLDRVAISVTSLNQDAANVFNNNVPNAGTTSSEPTYGYTVDQNGEVMLPLVGKIKVSGQTTEQLSAQLTQQLATYLSKPNVYVRIVNFRVAVLGDVMRPNVYTSPSERLTITEALSLAGDLNITAKRDDIILVREMDGKRTYVPIDLTSKKLFQSPYFYLKSNDLIFVQPSKLKLQNNDTGYQKAALIISALSLVAITVSLFVYNH
ncbi:polysaccharide export protein [Mucilaginibacter sp. RS28]|uniref:Polysaccharide export protein n=1 Tax=Mucilaginibacter straminoryzae TaxID=2932774 RepID=A0A9X1X4U8_9SPHI|nr:polysaccharide biosynthesis/export family protein [Mucilaginibacter straminoryzae]MCJ8211016.1 polysaccharide export protein [Mucilaginibacter straminoryzae]